MLVQHDNVLLHQGLMTLQEWRVPSGAHLIGQQSLAADLGCYTKYHLHDVHDDFPPKGFFMSFSTSLPMASLIDMA